MSRTSQGAGRPPRQLHKGGSCLHHPPPRLTPAKFWVTSSGGCKKSHGGMRPWLDAFTGRWECKAPLPCPPKQVGVSLTKLSKGVGEWGKRFRKTAPGVPHRPPARPMSKGDSVFKSRPPGISQHRSTVFRLECRGEREIPKISPASL